MQLMDHTPIDELVSELESADPAEAPPIADAVAARLSEELDDAAENDAGEASTA